MPRDRNKIRMETTVGEVGSWDISYQVWDKEQRWRLGSGRREGCHHPRGKTHFPAFNFTVATVRLQVQMQATNKWFFFSEENFTWWMGQVLCLLSQIFTCSKSYSKICNAEQHFEKVKKCILSTFWGCTPWIQTGLPVLSKTIYSLFSSVERIPSVWVNILHVYVPLDFSLVWQQ